MDVHCTTCREPWDVHHLWNDVIYDTALSGEECEAWHSLPSRERLAPRYRQALAAAQWEFGRTLVNVTWCPSCPKDAEPNLDRLITKAALESLFGDDEDGLAATYEDYRL